MHACLIVKSYIVSFSCCWPPALQRVVDEQTFPMERTREIGAGCEAIANLLRKVVRHKRWSLLRSSAWLRVFLSSHVPWLHHLTTQRNVSTTYIPEVVESCKRKSRVKRKKYGCECVSMNALTTHGPSLFLCTISSMLNLSTFAFSILWNKHTQNYDRTGAGGPWMTMNFPFSCCGTTMMMKWSK